jgi:hypothetical protein
MMNSSSLESGKLNQLKQFKKNPINININKAPANIFQQGKQSNIASSYKETSEKIRIQNFEKKLGGKKKI